MWVMTREVGRAPPSAGPTSDAPRVLTYTTRDVIDARISIPAQHSLVRLSKRSETSAAAAGLLAEIKAGRLSGIFCVNWEKAAQRALRHGLSWWIAIPKSEDAVLLLDPQNRLGGQPLIAFRRELDSDCGLLRGESRFPPLASRLDAALLKAWISYGMLRVGRIGPCSPGEFTIPIPSCRRDYARRRHPRQ